MKRIASLVMIIALLAFFFAFTLGGTVSAHAAHTTRIANALYSCSGDGCTSQDPSASGCAVGAYTIDSRAIFDANGNAVGLVELRASKGCGTNWSRVTTQGAVYPGWAEILREDGAHQQNNCPMIFGNSQTCWSPMIYSPVLKASAYGSTTANSHAQTPYW